MYRCMCVLLQIKKFSGQIPTLLNAHKYFIYGIYTYLNMYKGECKCELTITFAIEKCECNKWRFHLQYCTVGHKRERNQ